ncbi:hypothetical protein GSH05_19695, partial [Burkholderia pseudomallei]|uniref:hypothetical protein n=1 Tax=Burkholderia pseudomallei TaxID=28450 RepID=UPI00194029FA
MASRTNRLPRWLKILPGVILLGALLVAAGAALFLRASLPRLDGDVGGGARRGPAGGEPHPPGGAARPRRGPGRPPRRRGER